MTNGRQPLWEKQILARVLLDNNEVHKSAFLSLEAEDFEDDRNLLVFSAMKCLAREGKGIDLITLVEQLNSCAGDLENAGGVEYLASLVDEWMRYE
jgi:replicative DNA helicase